MALQDINLNVTEVQEEAVDNIDYTAIAQIDPKVVGSKSKNLELVATLADPSKPDKSITPKPGIPEVIGTIVGYAYKALKDIEVPDIGTTPFYKGDPMDFNPDNLKKTRKVKAGETFYLTHFENGLLLTNPEYNGTVQGPKGTTFVTAYAKANAAKKRPDGRPMLPLTSMRGEGISIRTLKQINVLECKDVTTAEGKKVKQKTLNKGFEKWAPLAEKRVATKASIKAKSGVRKNLLDAQAIYQSILGE